MSGFSVSSVPASFLLLFCFSLSGHGCLHILRARLVARQLDTFLDVRKVSCLIKTIMSFTTGTRALFLVATPLSDRLDWVLCKLQVTTPSTAPPINWHGPSGPPSSHPSITTRLCFAIHSAVGVMDWIERTGRIRTSRLYRGSAKHTSGSTLGRAAMRGEAKPGRKRTSARSRLSNSLDGLISLAKLFPINASPTSLGTTWGSLEREREREALLTPMVLNVYCSALLQNWTYRPVWWNCQSIATRLVFLLAELQTFPD